MTPVTARSFSLMRVGIQKDMSHSILLLRFGAVSLPAYVYFPHISNPRNDHHNTHNHYRCCPENHVIKFRTVRWHHHPPWPLPELWMHAQFIIFRASYFITRYVTAGPRGRYAAGPRQRPPCRGWGGRHGTAAPQGGGRMGWMGVRERKPLVFDVGLDLAQIWAQIWGQILAQI